MFGTQVALGMGFGAPLRESKAPKRKTSVIKGTKIKEKPGKLSKDLGKPAMKATGKELKTYIDKATTPSLKKKRVARVNLMKAHKKGHKAQSHKLGQTVSGPVRAESIIRPANTLAVIRPKYR